MARICVIVAGGVRAPRGIELARRFRADGHQVRAVLTQVAHLFLLPVFIRHPITMLRLYHPSFFELLSYFRKAVGSVSHINAAKWADVVVVAPATCNTISKMTAGISDSFPLLLVRALARGRKVVLAPSMNQEMWFDPCLQKNIDFLNMTDKYQVVGPGVGPMKSGDIGCGTMASLSTIMATTYQILGQEASLPKPAASTILVLDSPSPEREHFCAALAQKGYKVEVAGSRQQASEILEATAVDLVVVELSLLLTRALRPSPHQEQVSTESSSAVNDYDLAWLEKRRTIAMSSQVRAVAGAELLARHNIQFVPKPLNLAYMVTLVEGAVREVEGKWSQLP